MVISGLSPRAQDSDADHSNIHFHPIHITCCNGNLGTLAYNGLYDLW
ncbi:MAG: hypothetical protein ThorAB25_06470 [Candidatus Thorarchaeota archaeon AB_25]|nr:MAG: hypothetical protein ThorAB25_06470 [Candidatus Thorarchaeota archaeon AB_25]